MLVTFNRDTTAKISKKLLENKTKRVTLKYLKSNTS